MDNPYLLPFLKGFLLMGSLIFAVGPQNAMLIRQGLRRDRPFLIAAIFTLCDFSMIMLGIAGVGQYTSRLPLLRMVIQYGGAAFLFWFAAKAFYAAWRGGQSLNKTQPSRRGTLIATAFAVSLLNPGAIIDTIVIVGSVSSKYTLARAIAFGLGAQAFSTCFFFVLAGFTRRLAPAFNNPKVWRAIDGIAGLITLWIGLNLIFFEF